MSTIAPAREIRKHKLNTGFTWSMPAPGGLRLLTPEQYAAFDEHGFVKLEGVFSPQEVASVIAAIDPLEQRSEDYVRSQGGRISISEADVITFTTHLVAQ